MECLIQKYRGFLFVFLKIDSCSTAFSHHVLKPLLVLFKFISPHFLVSSYRLSYYMHKIFLFLVHFASSCYTSDTYNYVESMCVLYVESISQIPPFPYIFLLLLKHLAIFNIQLLIRRRLTSITEYKLVFII